MPEKQLCSFFKVICCVADVGWLEEKAVGTRHLEMRYGETVVKWHYLSYTLALHHPHPRGKRHRGRDLNTPLSSSSSHSTCDTKGAQGPMAPALHLCSDDPQKISPSPFPH